MKKYFIISDIHGHYYEMYSALSKAGFSPHNNDHFLISLGDLLDRGDKPLECLQYILSIPKERRILIRGNHEDLLEQAIERKRFCQHDEYNGTILTCQLLTNNQYQNEYVILKAVEENKLLNQYLSDLIDSYETNRSIFVHGWVPCYENGRQFITIKNPDKYDWQNARWINGMDAYRFGGKVEGKTIYCGHWHTSYGWSVIKKKCGEFENDSIFDIFEDDGICAIDACTAFTKRINCKVLNEDEI